MVCCPATTCKTNSMSYTTNFFITSDKDVPSCEKNISICLRANGFSFSLRSLKGELLTVGEVAHCWNSSMADAMRVIKQAFAEKGIILFGYNNAELMVVTDQAVWVPEALFDAANSRHYLDALYSIEKGHSVMEEYNGEAKAHVVFSADSNVVSAFKIVLPKIKVRCIQSAFVNAGTLGMCQEGSLVVANLRDGGCDISVMKEGGLLLSNFFACANRDELVYRLLNIRQQLGLEEEGRVLLCGDVDRELFAFVHHYFPRLDLYNGAKLRFPNPEMARIHRYKNAVLYV